MLKSDVLQGVESCGFYFLQVIFPSGEADITENTRLSQVLQNTAAIPVAEDDFYGSFFLVNTPKLLLHGDSVQTTNRMYCPAKQHRRPPVCTSSTTTVGFYIIISYMKESKHCPQALSSG